MHIVHAPPGFANAQLNGTECVQVHDGGPAWDFVTVLLLDGPEAGREWQIRRAHLRSRPVVTDAPH